MADHVSRKVFGSHSYDYPQRITAASSKRIQAVGRSTPSFSGVDPPPLSPTVCPFACESPLPNAFKLFLFLSIVHFIHLVAKFSPRRCRPLDIEDPEAVCTRAQVHGWLFLDCARCTLPRERSGLVSWGRTSSDFFPFHVSVNLLCRHHYARTLLSDGFDTFDTWILLSRGQPVPNGFILDHPSQRILYLLLW